MAQMYRMAQTLLRLTETGRLDPALLGRDAMHSLAAGKALEEIGNQAWELSRDYIDVDLGVPIHQLSGLRHRMAHTYGSIDWGITRDVVEEDVRPLRDRLAERLSDFGYDVASIDNEVEASVSD